jgi:SAM-dependent methyltransferase
MRGLLRNTFYGVAGLVFLTLARLKQWIQGYRTPRPFTLEDPERCIAYDMAVVDDWLALLRDYTGEAEPVRDRAVLELGPGVDLGVAGYLLALGARRYDAADAHPLLARVPSGFYQPLFRRLAERPTLMPTDELRVHLEAAHAGRDPLIRWRWHADFDLVRLFEPASIDVVVSQAAFEHFDDVPRTFAQLAGIARPGASLVAEVDLQTHSRWIRTHDPLNLYRYPDALYRLFHFKGSPNRLRPRDYESALLATGWRDVRIVRKGALSDAQLREVRPHLQPRYRADDADMRSLSIVILARRPGAS